jgi:HEAT repeat protein
MRRTAVQVGIMAVVSVLLSVTWRYGWTIAGEPQAAATPAKNASASEDDPVVRLRQEILTGPFGKMPIADLLEKMLTDDSPRITAIYAAMVARKAEALSPMLEKLRTGPVSDKMKVTKLLRFAGWPEAVPDLLKVAVSPDQPELARTGALYALGGIGDPSVGSALIPLLDKRERSNTEKRVLMATLARLGARDAVSAIRQQLHSEQLLVRIYAAKSLVELTGKPDADLVDVFREGLKDEGKWLIRKESCAGLGACGGEEARELLNWRSAHDKDDAVREEAQIALIKIDMSDKSSAVRAKFLEELAMTTRDRIQQWTFQALTSGCGDEGRKALRRISCNATGATAEMAALRLIVYSGAGPNFRGGY